MMLEKQIEEIAGLLLEARTLAGMLDDGSNLVTQKQINSVAVQLRADLYPLVAEILEVYRNVLPVKEDLLGSLSTVQTIQKRVALEEKIADMQAELDTM